MRRSDKRLPAATEKRGALGRYAGRQENISLALLDRLTGRCDIIKTGKVD